MKARGSGRRGHHALPDSCGHEGGPSLPAWKAFVVQFSRETAAGSGVFSGRVEHLHSGRRARFGSREALLATLESMLDEIKEPST
jgi:hypothetical protein